MDALGDIPEIPLDRIEPVPPMFGQRHLSLAESLVRPDSQLTDTRILAVLSLKALVRRLAAGAPTDALPAGLEASVPAKMAPLAESC